MDLSVIISTFESPDWLEKTLWGYAVQGYRDFELVVADDGSGPDTRERIDEVRRQSGLRIEHVWHEDRGFQKSAILNRAVEAAQGTYLVFSDGDCVPRSDFLEVHVRLRRRGRFLSGGYVKLDMEASRAVTEERIRSGEIFSRSWLADHGKPPRPFAKYSSRGRWARLLNVMTPTRPTWNGHNASGWKEDILAVNGFDERMQYGGQDRELGERLENNGVRGLQIRYLAICLHLDHPRGYARQESIDRNRAIRRETVGSRRTWTDHGIRK